jgi:predicted nucleic acid-binding protein
MDYLFDTNFIINYFKGIFEGNTQHFTDTIINKTTFISVITRIELLCGISSVEDTKLINEFISESVVFSLEENIIQQTILLRK